MTIALLAAGLAVTAAAGVFGTSVSPGPGGTAYHTDTYTVTKRSLTSQTPENGTLGDAGFYSVVYQAQSSTSSGSKGGGAGGSGSGGTITALAGVGSVIRQGHALYWVSGTPVVLLYGNIPDYRDLSEGDTGADVTELNTDLVSLGYIAAPDLGARSGWDYFSAETAYGVEAMLGRLGETSSGSLTLGAAVFLPGAIEVTGYGSNVVLGGSVTSGQVVLTGSSTSPVVTVQLDAADQSEVHSGESVIITLPDGSTTPGTVTSVSNTPSSSSNSSSDGNSNESGNGSGSGSPATVTMLVSLSNPQAAGSLNQAPVTVTITTGSVSNALVVPVTALLAQANGRYAVEVIGSDGKHHLVDVTPGLFDDAAGMVQVTGTGLAAGQHVVVPAS